MQSEINRLSKLVTPTAYQSARKHIFQSSSSLQWFVRGHREHLIRAGALLIVAGRLLIDERRFDAAVIAIGHAAVVTAGGACQ